LPLNSLYPERTVEKIGSEMEACAKAAPDENAEPDDRLARAIWLGEVDRAAMSLMIG
jgi:hypothetical protein